MRPTAQQLFMTVAKAYLESVKCGVDKLYINIEVVADILDHLNRKDDFTRRTDVILDDLSEDALITLLGARNENIPQSSIEND